MAKKFYTLDDLFVFCKTHGLFAFSSADYGYKLSVHVPATFESESVADDNHRGMLKLKVKMFHLGKNRNNSYVPDKAGRAAMNTIADRPLLAHIHQLDNGEWDFETHNMDIVKSDDGESAVEYIEKQIGSFSSEKPFIEHDDELGVDFVCAYAYVAEDYTKACDILRDKGGSKNSVELCIDEMSFSMEQDCISLDKFYVSGSTLLGRRDDGVEIQEGMRGSRADIIDFSTDNNSVKFEQNEEILKRIQKLEEAFNEYTSLEKGGDEMKFDELLQKYGVTLEDITFEYEGKTDEELEALFEEAFGESEPEPEGEGEPDVEPEGEEITDEANEDAEEVEEAAEEKTDEETQEVTATYSVSIGDAQKNYSVSITEKLNALTTLVNDTYADDQTYYSVDVFEDDKYVLMIDVWSNKAYKQSYKVKKDNYMLVGDRVEMYAVWVTADQKSELERMQSNYSSISEKLAKYEAEPEKAKILSNKRYGYIAEVKEFKELCENHFDISVDDVKAKADAILLEAIDGGKFGFAEKETKVSYKPLFVAKTGDGRYGDLFTR